MNRRLRYYVERVAVGVIIALILGFVRNASADTGAWLVNRFTSDPQAKPLVGQAFASSKAVCDAILAPKQQNGAPEYTVTYTIKNTDSAHASCDFVSTRVKDGNKEPSAVDIYFDSSKCAGGAAKDQNGQCPASDPADSCPAKGEERAFTVRLTPENAKAGLYPVLTTDPESEEGCGYAHGGEYGQSALVCGSPDQDNGDVYCTGNYYSTHTLPEAPDPKDTPTVASVDKTKPDLKSSSKQPQTQDESKSEPQTAEMSDGTTSTVQTETQTKSGGGFSVVDSSNPNGMITVTQGLPSTQSQTTTTTTTNNADNSSSVVTQTVTVWVNGERRVYTIQPNGTATVAVTPGTGGTHTTETTKSTDAGGATKTTKKSSGDDPAAADCSGEKCEKPKEEDDHADEKFDGDGSPNLPDIDEPTKQFTDYWGRVQKAPIVRSLGGIPAALPAGGECPHYSVDLPYIGQIELNPGCNILDTIGPTLKTIERAAWVMAAIFLFFTA